MDNTSGQGFWQQARRVYMFTLLAALLCFFLYLGVSMIVRNVNTVTLGDVLIINMSDDTRRQVVREVITDVNGDEIARETVTELLEGGGERLISDVWYTMETVVDAEKEREKIEESEAVLKKATTTAGETLATRVYVADPPVQDKIRSNPSAYVMQTMDWALQGLMLILYLCFAYSQMWHVGDHDAGQVKFKKRVADLWRGLKIGAAVMIPAAALFVVAILSKASGLQGEMVLRLFKLSNVCWLPLFQWLFPVAYRSMTELSWWGLLDFVLTFVPLPLIAMLAYRMGFKGISVREKILYRTKK